MIDADKLNKRVRVKFHGGREVVGVLKGFDPLVNLVLDETVEFLRGARRGPREEWCMRACSCGTLAVVPCLRDASCGTLAALP